MQQSLSLLSVILRILLLLHTHIYGEERYLPTEDLVNGLERQRSVFDKKNRNNSTIMIARQVSLFM